MLASFEKTADHLFEASVRSRIDAVSGKWQLTQFSKMFDVPSTLFVHLLLWLTDCVLCRCEWVHHHGHTSACWYVWQSQVVAHVARQPPNQQEANITFTLLQVLVVTSNWLQFDLEFSLLIKHDWFKSERLSFNHNDSHGKYTMCEFNPLLVITGSEIACVRMVVKCEIL